MRSWVFRQGRSGVSALSCLGFVAIKLACLTIASLAQGQPTITPVPVVTPPVVIEVAPINPVPALPPAVSTAPIGTELPVGLVKEKPSGGQFVETPQGYMIPYRMTIPGTEIAVEMVPIPGGTFLFGSPEGEAGHQASEGTPISVKVEPFWMARTETSWAQYKAYMGMHDLFKGFMSFKMRKVDDSNMADAITAPSNLYDPSFTYVNGQDVTLPAVTMSQYAAKQYTKWLTGLTGSFYRLPSEAEWEYAARAGTTTPWSFGNDAESMDAYAWYIDNAGETHPVGLKKENLWGLHDMHGNVGEWVLDAYSDEGHVTPADATEPVPADKMIRWPTELYPRVVKGGSYQSEATESRSASKIASQDDEWRIEDPNFPQSPWWFTEEPALGVGFRVIRPLVPPVADQRARYWDADTELIRDDVKHRIFSEGRGALGLVDPTLPAAAKSLREQKR